MSENNSEFSSPKTLHLKEIEKPQENTGDSKTDIAAQLAALKNLVLTQRAKITELQALLDCGNVPPPAVARSNPSSLRPVQWTQSRRQLLGKLARGLFAGGGLVVFSSVVRPEEAQAKVSVMYPNVGAVIGPVGMINTDTPPANIPIGLFTYAGTTPIDLSLINPGVGSCAVLTSSTGIGMYGEGGAYGVYGEHAGSGLGIYAKSAHSWGMYAQSNQSAGLVVEGNPAGAIWGWFSGTSGNLPATTRVGLVTLAYLPGTNFNLDLSTFSPGQSIGLYTNAGTPTGAAGEFAAVFAGDVAVYGSLSKGGGSFKIDHPLDPKNKYLYHSFVESPDMLNLYQGIATLDEQGEGWVELPEWFCALNRDFRYQLTPHGSYAAVYIEKEPGEGNRFKIGGGLVGMRVSWQVSGIRQDVWANANRIPVEEEKRPEERGTYLYPSLFNENQPY